MDSFGDLIRVARESKGLLLRQVAASVDKRHLVTSRLSDKIAYSIIDEENAEEALKVVEDKVKYLKMMQNGK